MSLVGICGAPHRGKSGGKEDREPSRQSAGKVKYPPRPIARPGPLVIRGREEPQRVDPRAE